MSLRNLAIASTLLLAACAGPNFAYACDTPVKDLLAEAARLELPVTHLDAGATKAFDAQAGAADADVDATDIIVLNPKDDDEDQIAEVLGSKDGCVVIAGQGPMKTVRVMIEKSQAAK